MLRSLEHNGSQNVLVLPRKRKPFWKRPAERIGFRHERGAERLTHQENLAQAQSDQAPSFVNLDEDNHKDLDVAGLSTSELSTYCKQNKSMKQAYKKKNVFSKSILCLIDFSDLFHAPFCLSCLPCLPRLSRYLPAAPKDEYLGLPTQDPVKLWLTPSQGKPTISGLIA